MSNNSSIPAPVPEVPEDQKFDGGIRIAWKPIERKIKVALQAQGLDGYIDGTVTKPEPKGDASSTKAPDPTPVFSDKPNLPEWRFRNNRTKGIIESFIADLPSFVPEVDDLDAHKLFEKLVSEFGQRDDMRKTLSMRRLRSHIYREDDTIDAFFKTLRDLRKEAIDMGNDVPDSVFREIVLAAFPTVAFDTIMQNINANPTIFSTSTLVMQQIAFQYSRSANQPDAAIPGDRLPQANSVSTLASRLETIEKQILSSANAVRFPEKKCKNCQRSGHVAEDCFRKGGGKEGQYPSWWKGKRDTHGTSTTGPAANTVSMRGFKGHLVGYGTGRGTYLLYTSSGQVVPSRDADFEERILPLLPPVGEEGRDEENIFPMTGNDTNPTDTNPTDASCDVEELVDVENAGEMTADTGPADVGKRVEFKLNAEIRSSQGQNPAQPASHSDH
ncbi:hypothetical protein F5880DRAFT_1501937 [Lentinula raphanica]|nr:hypothetical protein F5880DRAFT_1501937 [Lentinula raphanica]